MFLIRQPKHLLVLWLMLLAFAVYAIFTDARSWGTVPAIGLMLASSYEIARNLLASITVGRDEITLKGVRRTETLATDEFVAIERKSWWHPRPIAVTTSGSQWAPWWHPNLAAAVHVAIEDAKKELGESAE